MRLLELLVCFDHFVRFVVIYNQQFNVEDCKPPTNPLNARATARNGTTYLSAAEVQCKQGYRLIDGHQDNNATLGHIICTDNGTWEVSSGCELKGISNEEHTKTGVNI